MPYYTMRDGERIFAYVMGEGSPCVLVSGFGGRASWWIPLMTTLKGRGCQFILMDARGSGESARARHTKPHFEQFAEDLDDLLDAHGHDQAKLIGCSQGAYACLVKYKITGFSRISKFLLYEHAIKLSPAGDYQHGINPDVLKMYRAVVATWRDLKLDDPSVPFTQLPREFQPAYKAMLLDTWEYCFQSPASAKLARALYSSTNLQMQTDTWHGVMSIMGDYVDHDYGISLKDLEQMRIPVTVMYARRSQLFSNAAILEMAGRIPNVEVIAYESGHAFFLTEPRKFWADVAQFLKEPPKIEAQQTTVPNSRAPLVEA